MRGLSGRHVTDSTRRLTSDAAASYPPTDTGLCRCRDGVQRPTWPAVMASVWHRPIVRESAKDELAERQARAAVALVRLGHPGDVWRLLRHGADPRLRSFIVNWLHPLGADARTIVAALDRREFSLRPRSG